MAPALDPEDDRVREELRSLCIVGTAPRVCELLNAVPLDVLQGPVDAEGSSALHLAVRGGHLKLTQDLIQAGFDVDRQDARQRTPLHVVCMEDHADVVLELLFGQADVNVRDDLHQTPLHKVVQGQSLEVMKVLVQHGDPQLSAADARGTTPLLLAAEFGKVHFVEFLLSVDPGLAQAGNESGWTALHLCCHGREMRRNSRQVQHLQDGREVLGGKFDTCAKLLLEAKAPVDAFDEDRKTALHRACQTGNWESAGVLLQGGADVDSEDNCRWRPLHYAAQDGHLEVAKVLLKAKATVQKQNPSCLTPLAVATMENQIHMAELLMKHGADHGLRGKGLASPIMIARKDPQKYADLLALFELGFVSHEN